jgi:hypothetical protein
MDENILDGLFFLGDNWQGRIIGKVEKGLYAVQLYEWLLGAESCIKIVPLEQMSNWSFYDSTEDWHKAAERKTNE